MADDLKRYLEKDVYRIASKQHNGYVVLKFYRAGTRNHRRVLRTTKRAYHHREAMNKAHTAKLLGVLGCSRENRDEHERNCKKAKLATPAATEMEKRLSDERDVSIIEKQLLKPGAWRCSKCHSAVMAHHQECRGYLAKAKCTGAQVTAWGG